MTLREALTRATGQLSMHPELRPTALPDAALLLMHTLAIERPALIAHPERKLEREQQAVYQSLIARRLTFEPIQYILGTQEFYGLTLRVTPATLIPRPETELLVESILKYLLSFRSAAEESAVRTTADALRILDLGTGSGAIAIALAVHLPHARITAIDLSPEALTIARENAQTHHAHITFLQSDLLSAIPPAAEYDIIVSNPPYIPATEALHPQVRQHEPHQALFAGPTGLAIYERLIPQAAQHLTPNGLLALEIGHGQREALTGLLTDWRDVTFHNDLQQIPRIVLASRP